MHYLPIYIKANLLIDYNFIFNLLDRLSLHRATIYIYIIDYKFLFIKVCNETTLLIIVIYYIYIRTLSDANFLIAY